MPAATGSFCPVENIELLTRYGSEEAEVQLDRLGGGAWQARKARMKQAHPRDGRCAHEDRRRPRAQGRAAARAAGRPLRRVLGTLPIRGDGRPAQRHRRRARRSRHRPADGPARLRRCRLRQDRGRPARRLRHGDGGQAGRRDGADDAPGAPAFPHLHRALPRPAAERSRRPPASCRARR